MSSKNFLTASVTVIIPAYNAENTIISALKSLFEQTIKPEKIIVVDDGSTDGTKQTVTDFAAENIVHQLGEGFFGRFFQTA